MRRLALSLILLAAAGGALAQSVVGRALVEGREVELLSDNTWRFAGEARADQCRTVKLGVTFCGSPQEWVLDPNPGNPDISALLNHRSGRYFGMLIVEPFGTANGFDRTFMRTAILGNEMIRETVVQLDSGPGTLGGHEGEMLHYAATIDGLDIVYANTYVVLEDRAVQAVVASLGRRVSDEHRALHAAFVEAVGVE